MNPGTTLQRQPKGLGAYLCSSREETHQRPRKLSTQSTFSGPKRRVTVQTITPMFSGKK